MRKAIISILVASVLGISSYAQEFKMPASSPITKVEQQFSISSIDLEYSRPAMKGRKIFGDMIPFGKLWRTGANATSKITFKEKVTFGGVEVQPGTYSIYTIPNKDSWTVILNSGLKNWGLSGYNKEEDVAKVEAKVQKLNHNVENLTIDLNNITTTSAHLTIAWEQTMIEVEIVANNKDQILAYLDQQLKTDKPPYQQAANYYLDQNYKLEEAIKFADKAIESNQDAFWLHWLKARIYAKQGNKVEAIKSATISAEKAKGTDYEAEYQKNLENLKAQMK